MFGYRTRLAPSPTGFLHLGHGRTFWFAWDRCRRLNGSLVLRTEDLDYARCKPEFVRGAMTDIQWLGLNWDTGPYFQSERLGLYRVYLQKLIDSGCAYPCWCSRKDILEAAGAPHESGDEPVYPGTCRNRHRPDQHQAGRMPAYRFRIPDNGSVRFLDGFSGPHEFQCGRDFGDFVLWRQDGIPSYQLAIVVDDYLMGISEVVRGEDLLKSTARQILIYQALGWKIPNWYHCPLMLDKDGTRLAKRHKSLSLRQLRSQGTSPNELISIFQSQTSHWPQFMLDDRHHNR